MSNNPDPNTNPDQNSRSSPEYEEVIFVPQPLQQLGITRMARENQKFTILYEITNSTGQPDPILIYFDVKQQLSDTLEEFQKKASKNLSLRLKPELIQKTVLELSRDAYCRRILTYFDMDRIGDSGDDDDDPSNINNNDNSPQIGEPKRNNDILSDQQEQAYACSVSDPDFTDEGLSLIRVSTAIREDDGPKRVYGVIDTVRPLFKLPTRVYFACQNTDCRRRGISQLYTLSTPIFFMEDLPIAFEGGRSEYERYLVCPVCRQNRQVTADNRHYANAKIIELRNSNTGTISLSSVNSTLNMEQLTVIVFNEKTFAIGLGEEVEIVGNMYVLPSSMAFARFGNNSRGGGGHVNIRNIGESGKAQPVLYARRMRYTKRQQQLELTNTDRIIIQRLAGLSSPTPDIEKRKTKSKSKLNPKPKPKGKPKSKLKSVSSSTKAISASAKAKSIEEQTSKPSKKVMTNNNEKPSNSNSKQEQNPQPSAAVIANENTQPKRYNVVSILAKQLAPRIYDKTGGIAKTAVLLTLVGAAPKHERANYYGDRYWINTILAGDKGCGKTSLMEKAVNERVGGQLVSAQHSTGKGAVAIAEREGGSGVAILRIGPAALANGSVCGIDEFQLFDYESQDQFLDLQQSGCIYFNKLGIHQLIQAHTNFIATVNPTGGRWRDSRTLSLGEVTIKEQLWDRQDYFVIFKSDQTAEERDEYSRKKIELSQLQLRPGHSLLKKYIHYVNADSRLQETKFSDFSQVTKLRLFWNKLSAMYGDIMGNRSFETVFRTASAVARTMQKVEVDSEVTDFTIDFLGKMYGQLDEKKIDFVDPATTTYDIIRKAIKEYSQKQYWAEHQQQEVQLADMTFDQAAEIARGKDKAAREYLGDTYRSNQNRAARHLRKLFRENQNHDYDGGKIIVTSKSEHSQLTLK